MKRLLLFAAAASAVLALPATAAAFSGVVVAKDPARHALVIASRGGVVRTVRAPGHVRAVRAGARLVFSARRLSDGTFKAGRLRVAGHMRRAVLRGTVVRHHLSHYLLSTGGSVIALRASTRDFASAIGRGRRAGDRVQVRVRIGRNGLTATSFKDLGHANSLELEGIFLDVKGNQLRLAVERRGEVFVTVPSGFQLPPLRPGDEIELDVSVDATTGAFTLLSIRTDDEEDGEHGKVEVRGTITNLSDTSITVSPGREDDDAADDDGHGSPVTCAVTDKALLSGFQMHDKVEMRCAMVNGKLTLVRLEKEDDGDDD
jgi:hypothetical protein